MSEKRVSIRYARALFNTAKDLNIEDVVLNDCNHVSSTISHSKELRTFFKSPVIRYDKKQIVISELFAKEINVLTLNFLNLITSKHRESLIVDIIVEYKNLYNEKKGIINVEIATAIDIDATMKSEIEAKLHSITNKKVIAAYSVKPEIKGGVTVQINDWVYDGSVANQLKQLYNDLKSGN